jgi:UDP-N-acetylmuramoylalanine--D-glutamate ligase
MERAVELAAKDASYSQAEEPVILLSPACASYDQYRNFEERGQHFKDLIRSFLDIYPVWED